VSLSSLGHKFTQGAVDKVMEKQIFNDFQKAFYKGPHAAVHIGVGGESKKKDTSLFLEISS
jgi:hypothetical protein